ncbi:MAG: hypothetical protein M1816_004330 [Peltula sp. TS41687]|nr:MAG: hypothetical protein M1816_004330 [Peltula sp. TS41687]
MQASLTLLAPLGQHRRNHIEPSKGKRVKKRKVQEARSNEPALNTKSTGVDGPPPVEPPEPPLLTSYVTIGFNSTTRHLESLSQLSKPKSSGHSTEKSASHAHPTDSVHKDGTSSDILSDSAKAQEETTTPTHHIAAVFVPRSSQPSVLHAHLPLLTYTASMAHPSLPPTRLVTLPKGSEVKLCDALALPRISFIGIMEQAPHASPLIEYVRQHVRAIDVPWLRPVARGEYLPVHINAIQTTAPVVSKAKKGTLNEEETPKRKRGPGEDGIGGFNRKKARRGEKAEQEISAE